MLNLLVEEHKLNDFTARIMTLRGAVAHAANAASPQDGVVFHGSFMVVIS